jgi:hypothetical protein
MSPLKIRMGLLERNKIKITGSQKHYRKLYMIRLEREAELGADRCACEKER